MLLSVKELNVWRKFHELITVLLIMFGLIGIYALLQFINAQNWWIISDSVAADVSDALKEDIDRILIFMTDCTVLLSLLTTPLAVFFAATNDRLSFPIRLLASAENANKFVYAIGWALTYSCRPKSGPFQCSQNLIKTFDTIQSIINKYNLVEISQCCQLLISMR
ncbi:unnamed protein product, partial [Mesorhabditis belari]|uniref:Uncharacterized protein n=1 Tax=Mesorhabditis belari TaxID=2138241 RepID=A0AAF3J442_9BILA